MQSIQMQKTGAQFIAETLKAYGVSHVFLVMAILRRTLVELERVGIRRVVAHSEKAAAYMADGYARIGRKPGVCMAQSVGAANLAAGLQDPYLAHSPVIAVTGRKGSAAQYKNAYQEIVHAPMYQAVTKYDANVDTIEQLPGMLYQSFREATSGAPRPVHLDMLGFAGEVIESAELISDVLAEESHTRCPAFRPVPERDQIRAAANQLTQAKRPVIVAGGGVNFSGAAAEVVQLAEMLSIPVATSNDGKGIIPDIHPLSVGVVGSYSCQCANQVVSEADLVLYIGSGTGDQVTHNWTIPGPAVSVIQVDINPGELGRNYRNTLGLHGDARETLRLLLQALESGESRTDWTEKARGLLTEWKTIIEPLCNSNDIPIRPERLCQEISDRLPPDGILVADTGFSAVWTSTMLDLKHAGQRYLRAAGSLGWAFPASLGAKCAAPNRPVLCFTGDGGFWYHLAELETARRWGIHTVTVVNNNSGFGQCIIGVDNAYGNDAGQRRDVYGFEAIDFARIAQEIGCLGIRVESPHQISAALHEALAADQPAVVDVVTDIGYKPPPVWTPKRP